MIDRFQEYLDTQFLDLMIPEILVLKSVMYDLRMMQIMNVKLAQLTTTDQSELQPILQFKVQNFNHFRKYRNINWIFSHKYLIKSIV